MARTDDDSWEITDSVGSTALFVAASRALEARKPRPLAVDQFAEVFCRAAGGQWAQLADGSGPIHEVLGSTDFGHAFVDYQGARAKYFDELFRNAAEAGVRQFVILASGLDSRAHRLSFPAGSRVFELDQPQVLAFKAETLHGHSPKAVLDYVPVDLRDEWRDALVDVGFDPAKPTAWLIEGLLMYVPATAETAIFERVAELSAPGSHVGIEQMQPIDLSAFRSDVDAHGGPNAGAVAAGRDWASLIYNEEREDAGEWFAARGFQASAVTVNDLVASYGREVGFTGAAPTTSLFTVVKETA